jgi:hypothetical protein
MPGTVLHPINPPAQVQDFGFSGSVAFAAVACELKNPSTTAAAMTLDVKILISPSLLRHQIHFSADLVCSHGGGLMRTVGLAMPTPLRRGSIPVATVLTKNALYASTIGRTIHCVCWIWRVLSATIEKSLRERLMKLDAFRDAMRKEIRGLFSAEGRRG